MKLGNKIALATAAFVTCAAAHASTLSYAFNGPAFTDYSGAFTATDRITGLVSFDSSLLAANGTGSFTTSSSGINPLVTWSFQDGHNTFNNVVTTNNFTISMSFNAYNPTGWNIDATHGFTSQDIWINSGGAYMSIFQGFAASSDTPFTAANISRVPEPGSLALAGIGLLGLMAARRKKQANQ
ncbi:PEP-CTERM sorting domain-containing protein [Pseudoduganella sp. LjRoot289]|uniref:PEP-CTERM sorting domain-containing protein n=1 Tax=Pseudoduganella sp. LjRoot289 TaxID=3342314 RepID=UPI003ECD4BE9